MLLENSLAFHKWASELIDCISKQGEWQVNSETLFVEIL
jgi:hypothetical protein